MNKTRKENSKGKSLQHLARDTLRRKLFNFGERIQT